MILLYIYEVKAAVNNARRGDYYQINFFGSGVRIGSGKVRLVDAGRGQAQMAGP